jgi:hypothetical protein
MMQWIELKTIKRASPFGRALQMETLGQRIFRALTRFINRWSPR